MTGLRSFAPNDADVTVAVPWREPDSTPPRPAGEQTLGASSRRIQADAPL